MTRAEKGPRVMPEVGQMLTVPKGHQSLGEETTHRGAP